MKRNKYQIKRIKGEKLRYKKMIKKYPWLKPIKWARKTLKEIRDPHFDYSYVPIFDNMSGWWRAFGKMFCNEIQEQYKYCPNLYVMDYKEKWGGLRIEFGGANQEVIDICEKYERLSENICFICGKPDVYVTNAGWVLPLCKECYEKHWDDTRSYEEVIEGEPRMSDEIIWKSSEGERHIDISETANKIRRNWHGR